MIPTPPPRRRNVPLNSEFVPVSPGFAAQVRRGCRWTGIVSVILVAFTLLGVLVSGLMLLVALPLGGIFAAMLGGLACGFALTSSIALARGASFVNAGYLNVTYARHTRRTLVIMLIGAIFSSAVATLFLTVDASNSGVFPPAAQVCLSLVWVPCLFSLFAVIVGTSLLGQVKPAQT